MTIEQFDEMKKGLKIRKEESKQERKKRLHNNRKAHNLKDNNNH